MSKINTSIIWVILAALLLIVLVYVYYERQMDAIKEKIESGPP